MASDASSQSLVSCMGALQASDNLSLDWHRIAVKELGIME